MILHSPPLSHGACKYFLVIIKLAFERKRTWWQRLDALHWLSRCLLEDLAVNVFEPIDNVDLADPGRNGSQEAGHDGSKNGNLRVRID